MTSPVDTGHENQSQKMADLMPHDVNVCGAVEGRVDRDRPAGGIVDYLRVCLNPKTRSGKGQCLALVVSAAGTDEKIIRQRIVTAARCAPRLPVWQLGSVQRRRPPVGGRRHGLFVAQRRGAGSMTMSIPNVPTPRRTTTPGERRVFPHQAERLPLRRTHALMASARAGRQRRIRLLPRGPRRSPTRKCVDPAATSATSRSRPPALSARGRSLVFGLVGQGNAVNLPTSHSRSVASAGAQSPGLPAQGQSFQVGQIGELGRDRTH